MGVERCSGKDKALRVFTQNKLCLFQHVWNGTFCCLRACLSSLVQGVSTSEVHYMNKFEKKGGGSSLQLSAEHMLRLLLLFCSILNVL